MDIHSLTKPTNDNLFFSKNDADDPRFGDLVKIEFSKSYVTLLGYPDHRGVRNNGGRMGAEDGPKNIRKYFYKMTPPLDSPEPPQFFDFGDLILDDDIGISHEKAQSLCAYSLAHSKQTITLGGGHDYAFADGIAFLEHYKNSSVKPLIINIDAHLDVREETKDLTSGTPFYRIKKKYPKAEIVQLGIQDLCNSKKHFQFCKDNNIKVITQSQILNSNKSLSDFVMPQLESFKGAPLYLSVDIDGFSSSFAPGCSQSWPLGIHPFEFFKLLTKLKENFETPLMGIYEVAPELDSLNITSKLSAQLMHHFIS